MTTTLLSPTTPATDSVTPMTGPPETAGRPAPAADPNPTPAAADARRLAWHHGAGKDLLAAPARPIRTSPAAVDAVPLSALPGLVDAGTTPSPPVAERSEAAIWGAATAYGLRAGLLPTRWDDWSGHNAHRPFPSPRAQQAHEVHVRTPAGSFAVDEVRGLLIPSGPGGAPAIVVRTRPDRIPEGYGRMRIALSLLEVGHIVDELGYWLTSVGRRPTYAVRVLAPEAVEAAEVVITHGGDIDCEPAVIPDTLPTRPRRCSGLDVRGLSPDPRPLSGAALHALVSGAPASDRVVRHRLGLRGVEGVPDGVAEHTSGGLQHISRRPPQRLVSGAIRGPHGVLDVDRMNVLWGISAPLTAVLRDCADYARLLIDVGAAAQQVCRAAARAGLFARPMRGIDEPDVEAALHLPSGDDLLYLILIGRPRVSGFTYDLSPAAPPVPDSPTPARPATATTDTEELRP